MRQNIYNVPDGFFEQMQKTAMDNASRIRRARRTALLTSSGCIAAAVAFLLVLPIFRPTPAAPAQSELYADIFDSNEDMIEFYECDIFLNNL